MAFPRYRMLPGLPVFALVLLLFHPFARSGPAPATNLRAGDQDTGSARICGAVWSTRNLDVLSYRNGDTIPQVTDPSLWKSLKSGAWCWYDNDSAKYSHFGKLYNWYAVNDPRGLAPEGWEIPGEEQWAELNSCTGSDSIAFRLRGKGWPGPAREIDNSTGFNGLPGGYRSAGGNFDGLANSAIFWTRSEGSAAEAWCFRLLYHIIGNDRSMGNGVGYMPKTEGYSVRCVKKRS